MKTVILPLHARPAQLDTTLHLSPASAIIRLDALLAVLYQRLEPAVGPHVTAGATQSAWAVLASAPTACAHGMAKRAARIVKLSQIEYARIARLAKFRTGTLALPSRHRSATSVQKDDMTLILILLLHAQAVQ